MDDDELFVNLLFIEKNFTVIQNTILLLEEQGMPLTKSVELILNLKQSLHDVPGEAGQIIRDKFESVLTNNSFFSELKNLSKIFSNSIVETSIKKEFWEKFFLRSYYFMRCGALFLCLQ